MAVSPKKRDGMAKERKNRRTAKKSKTIKYDVRVVCPENYIFLNGWAF